MLRSIVGVIGFLLPCAALAQAPVSAHARYDAYAAGLHVAEVNSGFEFSRSHYHMTQAWHTIGPASLFFSGHQSNRVSGAWQGNQARPAAYVGQGEWRGAPRVAKIEYRDGKPIVRQLVPAAADEQEPVPDSLQEDSIDNLSALAQLLRVVAESGRCDTSARTFDGRRAVAIEAHTVGEEVLPTTSRSSFTGKALRCDFSGRLLAGFKIDDNRSDASKPMHGSAWLAAVVPGAPPLPVRIAFETRWVGEAVMYLTETGRGSEPLVAQKSQ